MGRGEQFCWELGCSSRIQEGNAVQGAEMGKSVLGHTGKGAQAELAELNLPEIVVWTMSREGRLRPQEKKIDVED